jgi:hypothetical protein
MKLVGWPAQLVFWLRLLVFCCCVHRISDVHGDYRILRFLRRWHGPGELCRQHRHHPVGVFRCESDGRDGVNKVAGFQPGHRVAHCRGEVDVVDGNPGARTVAGDPVQDLGRAAAGQHAESGSGAHGGRDAVRSKGAVHGSGLGRGLAPCGREDDAGPGSLDGAPQRLHALDVELALDHLSYAIGGRLGRITASHDVCIRRVPRQPVGA